MKKKGSFSSKLSMCMIENEKIYYRLTTITTFHLGRPKLSK